MIMALLPVCSPSTFNNPQGTEKQDRPPNLFLQVDGRIVVNSTSVELRGFEPLTPTLPVWCECVDPSNFNRVSYPQVRRNPWPENTGHRPSNAGRGGASRSCSHLLSGAVTCCGTRFVPSPIPPNNSCADFYPGDRRSCREEGCCSVPAGRRTVGHVCCMPSPKPICSSPVPRVSRVAPLACGVGVIPARTPPRE